MYQPSEGDWQTAEAGRADIATYGKSEAVALLHSADSTFSRLAQTYALQSAAHRHHAVREAAHQLAAALEFAHDTGMEKNDIRAHLPRSREVFLMSDFARRAITWPRGYKGDYETISYLLDGRNHHDQDTLAYIVHQYCLDNPMAQQHRNKVRAQSIVLLKALLRSESARVLSIACGGCADFEDFIEALPRGERLIVLNDSDPAALERAKAVFERSECSPTIVEGNVLQRIGGISRLGPFDAVVAGGLFDYLDDRAARLLLRAIVTKMLRPGGTLFFTNIARGCPYMRWMECVVDWPLIERSEDDLRTLLCDVSDEIEFEVKRDLSGLALLATAKRRQPGGHSDQRASQF